MARVMRANSRLSTNAFEMGVTFISMDACCAPPLFGGDPIFAHVRAQMRGGIPRRIARSGRQRAQQQPGQFILGLIAVARHVEYHEFA